MISPAGCLQAGGGRPGAPHLNFFDWNILRRRALAYRAGIVLTSGLAGAVLQKSGSPDRYTVAVLAAAILLVSLIALKWGKQRDAQPEPPPKARAAAGRS